MKPEKAAQGGGLQCPLRDYLPHSRLHEAHSNDSNKVNSEIKLNVYGLRLLCSTVSTVLIVSTDQWSGKSLCKSVKEEEKGGILMTNK